MSRTFQHNGSPFSPPFGPLLPDWSLIINWFVLVELIFKQTFFYCQIDLDDPVLERERDASWIPTMFNTSYIEFSNITNLNKFLISTLAISITKAEDVFIKDGSYSYIIFKGTKVIGTLLFWIMSMESIEKKKTLKKAKKRKWEVSSIVAYSIHAITSN